MLRRTLAATAVALCTAVTLLSVGGAAADPSDPSRPTAPLHADESDLTEAAITRASRLLEGPPVFATDGQGRDASLALRDVFVARPRMDLLDSWRAYSLLSRPADGEGDPYGDGYRVRSRTTCDGPICVHHVPRTADAPPDQGWVRTTLRVMNQVWRREVGDLGYRRPPSDGRAGGDGRFDVYLKELGSQGLYGYCAPERRVAGQPLGASGFCVLDDDFASSQFGRPAIESLRVTAAHEFFHAIQFGYDFREDPWLLESTATWMEERFADGIDDNRRYLRFGQVARPGSSMDLFAPDGLHQYGNWTFWEFLSQRYGPGVVREVWRRAGAFPGAPNRFSVRALTGVLAGRGGLPGIFGAYASGNTVSGRTYDEGASWPSAGVRRGWRLSAGKSRVDSRLRLNHLSSQNLSLRPARGLTGDRWRARIQVNAPGSRTSPVAFLLVHKPGGAVVQRRIPLNRKGFGRVQIPFDSQSVSRAVVTLANVSTRYRCRRGSNFSCQGAPIDQGRRFQLTARVLRR